MLQCVQLDVRTCGYIPTRAAQHNPASRGFTLLPAKVCSCSSHIHGQHREAAYQHLTCITTHCFEPLSLCIKFLFSCAFGRPTYMLAECSHCRRWCFHDSLPDFSLILFRRHVVFTHSITSPLIEDCICCSNVLGDGCHDQHSTDSLPGAGVRPSDQRATGSHAGGFRSGEVPQRHPSWTWVAPQMVLAGNGVKRRRVLKCKRQVCGKGSI